MANRVLIGTKEGSHGLYVSKPGVDVITASPQDLAFDSRLGNYASVLVSGTTTPGQTIYFADAGYVPLAYAQILEGGQLIGYRHYSRYTPTGNSTGLISTNNSVRVPSFTITSNSITFRGINFTPTNGLPTNPSIRYVVWRCPGGA